MDRRDFAKGIGASALAFRPGLSEAARGAPAQVYSTAGDQVTRWEVDLPRAALVRRESMTLPSVVQYGWPHPSLRVLYLASTDTERGSKVATGHEHFIHAFRIGSDGRLSPHGAPALLRQRPLHMSVDRAGRYAMVAYNAPAHVSVHRINPDGTLGAEVAQDPALDVGVFSHQILATPSNRTVTLVTRGLPGDPVTPQAAPGAIKVYRFADGRLSLAENVVPFGHGGIDYGPRHLDFHPTRPWAYVLVELQNQLHMHRMEGDLLAPEPDFVLPSTERPVAPEFKQVAGAIHVHPRGHVVYASNRVSATTHPVGPFPFVGGDNSIAVFSIDPRSGRPRPIQFADPHGFHVRAFTIDPTGTLLIAASLAAMTVGKGAARQVVPAGLSVFRIARDGRLAFANRYPVELGEGVQQMWVRAVAG